jgi:CHASE1-domain containing sensor protein
MNIRANDATRNEFRKYDVSIEVRTSFPALQTSLKIERSVTPQNGNLRVLCKDNLKIII